MDTPPIIEILGQHTRDCPQCQEAAREALAGNQDFWDEAVWDTFSCPVGNQLRQDAIQELS